MGSIRQDDVQRARSALMGICEQVADLMECNGQSQKDLKILSDIRELAATALDFLEPFDY